MLFGFDCSIWKYFQIVDEKVLLESKIAQQSILFNY